jgi:hypothetical protein
MPLPNLFLQDILTPSLFASGHQLRGLALAIRNYPPSATHLRHPQCGFQFFLATRNKQHATQYTICNTQQCIINNSAVGARHNVATRKPGNGAIRVIEATHRAKPSMPHRAEPSMPHRAKPSMPHKAVPSKLCTLLSSKPQTAVIPGLPKPRGAVLSKLYTVLSEATQSEAIEATQSGTIESYAQCCRQTHRQWYYRSHRNYTDHRRYA